MARSNKWDATTRFQSPAEDYIDPVINLAEIIDLRRPSRYPVRVLRDAIEGRGIFHCDILVTGKAGEPKPGKVCITFVNGDVIRAALSRN